MEYWCAARGIQAVPIAKAPSTATGGRAMVVALGGDGTVLRAAGWFADAGLPILGVNVGSLGFLTQIGLDEWPRAFERARRGECAVEERMRLGYETNEVRGSALNDVVVTGAAESPFCELEVSWGEEVVAAYPGDGLVLCTATGSTAYSLSAGGPVVVPPATCILATPHAAHALGLRPVVFPADAALRILARTDAQLIADGDLVGPLPAGSMLVVRRSAAPTRLVRLPGGPSFFRLLDTKLGWAGPGGRRRSG